MSVTQRVVVKVRPSYPHERPGFVADCQTGTCSWISVLHVAKVAAEEEARWHREFHKREQRAGQ